MHQALKVPEIFQLILFSIYDPKQARSHHWRGCELCPGSSHRDLAPLNSLARTCKYFSGPSLDVLWYFQINLKPLLKCLPDDSLECQKSNHYPEKLNLKRELGREDFIRVDVYARRIRIFGDPESAGLVSDAAKDGISALIYPTIISRRALWGLGPLLPNLIHLNMGLEKFGDLAWLPRLIIGPQLQFVNLVAFREDRDSLEYDIDWGNMFAALSPALPSLASLSFSVPTAYAHPVDGDIYSVSGPNEEVVKLIQAIPSPTVLRITSITLDAKTLRQIANLQTIKTLEISIIDIQTDDPLVRKLPELPNLLRLQVEADDPDLCSTLIRQLGPQHLRTLKVIRVEGSEHLWNMDQFIKSLRTSRFVSAIDDIEVITPSYEDKPNPTIPPITGNTIQHLSHFKKLRSIRLYLNGEVHLDTESLEKIASVWPNLQVLDLRSRHRTRLGEAITKLSLNELLAVTVKLPFLKEVRLQVHAIEEPRYKTLALPASGIAAPNLQILDVCTSVLSPHLVELVATLLRAAFPNLRRLLYGWEWPERYGEDLLEVELSSLETMSLGAWKMVKEMLNIR